MSVALEFRQVYHSIELRNESLFGKFSLISRDLEIFTMPRIVGRMKRSGLEFRLSGYSLFIILYVCHDIPVVTEKIFYVQPGSRPAIFYSCM